MTIMSSRVVKATRFGVSAGLALLLGVGFMPCGCGHTTGAVASRVASSEPEGPPDRRRVTKTVVQELTVCALEARASAPWRKSPEEMPTYWVEFDFEATEEGNVDLVTLTHSTLEDPGGERCMARALRGMMLPLTQMVKDLEEQGPISPIWADARPPLGADGRGLMGTTLPLPVVGGGGLIVLIPVVIVGIGIYIVLSSRVKTKAKTKDHVLTCPREVLSALEATKRDLCNNGYPATCTGDRERDFVRDRHDAIRCSDIRESIKQRRKCVEMRERIQKECYGGNTDYGHQEAIDGQQGGLDACLKLEAINCAEGHPMANL